MHKGVFYGVRKFSHVAGPLIHLQYLQHSVGNALYALAHLLVEFCYEVTHQEGNIFNYVLSRAAGATGTR